MTEGQLGAELCSKKVMSDFAAVIGGTTGQAVEIAFAEPNSSRFDSAVYLTKPSATELIRLAEQPGNVSFGSGYSLALLPSLSLGKRIKRVGADRHVTQKQIISFDLDFKDNVEGYQASQRQELFKKLIAHLMWHLIRQTFSLGS